MGDSLQPPISRPGLSQRFSSVSQYPPQKSSYLLLRAPGDKSAHSATPPPLDWLLGKWHVTHSTLPIWKDKRNVTITYTVLPSPKGTAPGVVRLEDLVEYQELKGDKIKSVRGVDTGTGDNNEWNWRGSGIIKIASAHWEVVGWGNGLEEKRQDVRQDDVIGRGQDDEQWMVTFFAKTVFTPAGMDFYARKAEGLSEKLVKQITAALEKLEDAQIRELARQLVVVRRDGVRAENGSAGND